MKKIIILLALCFSTLFALEYEKEKNLSSIDPKFIVGLEGHYSYTIADNMDKLNYGYGFYLGMPISDFEILLKQKRFTSDNFDSIANAVIINKNIDGTGIRPLYLGILAGSRELDFTQESIDSKGLEEKTVKNTFYGIHIGKKYKYSRNFGIRIELEYVNYGTTLKSTIKDLNIDSSIDFNYGVEYRF